MFAYTTGNLTLNAPMATKDVCFSRLLKYLRSLFANSVNPDQTAPIGAVCSGSTLFASIFNSSVMLGNCSRRIQQTTFSDEFFLGALRVKALSNVKHLEITPSLMSS